MIRIDGYPIDVAITQTPSFESDLTDHPVEQGSDVTDNIRTKPVSFEIEGIVSDTPLGLVAQDPSRQQSAGQPLPSQDAYRRLFDIWSNKRFVTLETDFGKFENMAVTRLTMPRSKDTGKALHFTGTFRQLRLVTNNRTTVRMAIPGGGKKTNLGNLISQKQASALFAPIYVIVRKSSDRPTLSKTFGEPTWAEATVSQVDRQKAGVTSLSVDCYDVHGTATKPDGWLTGQLPPNKDPYVYHSIGAGAQSGGFASSATELNPTINGQPVHYDYADKTWKRDGDNKVLTHVPPDEDKWKYVTIGKK